MWRKGPFSRVGLLSFTTRTRVSVPCHRSSGESSFHDSTEKVGQPNKCQTALWTKINKLSKTCFKKLSINLTDMKCVKIMWKPWKLKIGNFSNFMNLEFWYFFLIWNENIVEKLRKVITKKKKTKMWLSKILKIPQKNLKSKISWKTDASNQQNSSIRFDYLKKKNQLGFFFCNLRKNLIQELF